MTKEMNTNKIQQFLEEEVENDFIGLKSDQLTQEVAEEFEKIQKSIDEKKKEYILENEPNDYSEQNKKGRKKNYRVTEKERKKRIREVIEMTNRGFTYSEIVTFCKTRWQCSDRNVERYIAMAKKVETVPEKELKIYRSNNISRCLYIYKKAVLNNNENAALAALKEMNKLIGLYPDQILGWKDGDDDQNPVSKILSEISKGGLTKDDIVDGAIEVDEK